MDDAERRFSVAPFAKRSTVTKSMLLAAALLQAALLGPKTC
jgi:hypothetical protein